jgi:osmotically-inducible protein OsmY
MNYNNSSGPINSSSEPEHRDSTPYEQVRITDASVVASRDDRQLADDKVLCNAIAHELHVDALTFSLIIDIQVEEGIVYLYGSVPTFQDVLNVENVAARVPGINNIIEDLDIANLS